MVKRSMRKSKSRSARRSARRSRSMRGGRLTGDSSYSTYLNSDNTSNIAGSSVAALQNTDRNNSAIAGEGAPINMNAAAFQGLYPPQAYYGGKRGSKSRRGRQSRRGSKSRRSRKMRGGKSTAQLAYGTLPNPDDSVGANDDVLVRNFEGTHNNMTPAQLFQGAIGAVGGSRRRRRHRGGYGDGDSDGHSPQYWDNITNEYIASEKADEQVDIAREAAFSKNVEEAAAEQQAEYSRSVAEDSLKRGGGRRRRRSMKGGSDVNPNAPMNPDKDRIEGMYDNNHNPVSPNAGGGRRKRRGGGIIATAALPFGLFGLQRLFQSRNASKTRKHRR